MEVSNNEVSVCSSNSCKLKAQASDWSKHFFPTRLCMTSVRADTPNETTSGTQIWPWAQKSKRQLVSDGEDELMSCTEAQYDINKCDFEL